MILRGVGLCKATRTLLLVMWEPKVVWEWAVGVDNLALVYVQTKLSCGGDSCGSRTAWGSRKYWWECSLFSPLGIWLNVVHCFPVLVLLVGVFLPWLGGGSQINIKKKKHKKSHCFHVSHSTGNGSRAHLVHRRSHTLWHRSSLLHIIDGSPYSTHTHCLG